MIVTIRFCQRRSSNINGFGSIGCCCQRRKRRSVLVCTNCLEYRRRQRIIIADWFRSIIWCHQRRGVWIRWCHQRSGAWIRCCQQRRGGRYWLVCTSIWSTQLQSQLIHFDDHYRISLTNDAKSRLDLQSSFYYHSIGNDFPASTITAAGSWLSLSSPNPEPLNFFMVSSRVHGHKDCEHHKLLRRCCNSCKERMAWNILLLIISRILMSTWLPQLRESTIRNRYLVRSNTCKCVFSTFLFADKNAASPTMKENKPYGTHF